MTSERNHDVDGQETYHRVDVIVIGNGLAYGFQNHDNGTFSFDEPVKRRRLEEGHQIRANLPICMGIKRFANVIR